MEDQSTVLFAGWWRCHGHLGSDRRKAFGCEWKQYKCITITHNSSSWSASCSSLCLLCFLCLIQVLHLWSKVSYWQRHWRQCAPGGLFHWGPWRGTMLSYIVANLHSVWLFISYCDGFIRRIKSNFMMNLCLFYRCHQLLVLFALSEQQVFQYGSLFLYENLLRAREALIKCP